MRADARVACVDLVLLCIVVTMLCSVAVHSDWLECPGEKWFRRWRRREGAVGITFANIAANSRFAIGCICGSFARSHVKSSPPPPASRQAGETVGFPDFPGISGFPQFSVVNFQFSLNCDV
jgi:hypothetical protein